MSLKRERSAWKTMIRRCEERTHADFRRYGAKGITVCPQWRTSFQQFLHDLGPAPSPLHWLGRLDVLGNYEPANCRWTTHEEQMRRRAFCKKVKLNGQQLTLAEASRLLNLHDSTLYRRIVAYGLTLSEACKPGKLPRRIDILLTHQGETLTLAAWSKRTGIPRAKIYKRLRYGWQPGRVLDPEGRNPPPPDSLAVMPPATPMPNYPA